MLPSLGIYMIIDQLNIREVLCIARTHAAMFPDSYRKLLILPTPDRLDIVGAPGLLVIIPTVLPPDGLRPCRSCR